MDGNLNQKYITSLTIYLLTKAKSLSVNIHKEEVKVNNCFIGEK